MAKRQELKRCRFKHEEGLGGGGRSECGRKILMSMNWDEFGGVTVRVSWESASERVSGANE